MKHWPFGRKPKQEHYLGEYTEPSFRGAILILVVSLIVLTLLWLAYGWALNQHGVPDPDAAADLAARLTEAIVAG